jgi:predicted RNase H-like nuclease (RuvC/YqgF family)
VAKDDKPDTKTEKKTDTKSKDSSSSSSDEETPDSLGKDDIKKVKQLIMDQDTEIENLKEEVKKFKEKYLY